MSKYPTGYKSSPETFISLLFNICIVLLVVAKIEFLILSMEIYDSHVTQMAHPLNEQNLMKFDKKIVL
jgi:hypothetical protein